MQKNPLTEKVALITGSARRIGAAIARVLHDAGMKIVLHYNVSETEVMTLCAEFNQKRPSSAVAISAQLEESESVQELMRESVKAWQRLDVLVNNASRFYKTPMGKVTDFEWNDLFNTNLKAPFFLAQTAAPYLAAHKGSIINITDTNGAYPLSDFPVYCISKGALEIMTRVLAKELGPTIRVNGVAPGAIVWPEGQNAINTDEKQKIIARTPLQRSGEVEDIAKAVLFFVRDSDFVTGQILNVDGGRTFG